MICHLSSSRSESTISKPKFMETSNSNKNTHTKKNIYQPACPKLKLKHGWSHPFIRCCYFGRPYRFFFPRRFVVSFGIAEGLMTLGMYATRIWDRSPGWRCSGRTWSFIFPWDLLMMKYLVQGLIQNFSRKMAPIIFFGMSFFFK